MSLTKKAQSLAANTRNVRVLTIDIESKPMTVYAWGLWDQRIGINQIVDHGGLLCFAAKWMGEKDVMFFSEHHHGYDTMLRKAHELLSEADVVITYNGDRYDFKKLNQAFMIAGFPPPRPYKSIDLMKTNRARFDLPSKKLDYLAQQAGTGRKVKHQGFDLWIDCMAGDEKAWKVMERYNKADVTLTERTYLRLLPWITNAPHLGMFTRDGHSCPYCGGKDSLSVDGFAHANVTSYWMYECKRCGGWVRGVTKHQDPTRTRAIR